MAGRHSKKKRLSAWAWTIISLSFLAVVETAVWMVVLFRG